MNGAIVIALVLFYIIIYFAIDGSRGNRNW